jgi:hypothetical protein
MRIRNYTDFPVDKIRDIIKFVKPNGLSTSNFDIKVTNASHNHCGVFYEKGGYSTKPKAMGTADRPLIIARITKNENEYPHFTEYQRTRRVTLYWDQYNERKEKWQIWHHHKNISKCNVKKTAEHWYNWRITKLKDTGGYIDNLILSREEALVHVLAHEFRHYWQTNHLGRRGKFRGERRSGCSDTGADIYAIRKVRAWRRLHNQPKGLNWNLIEKRGDF